METEECVFTHTYAHKHPSSFIHLLCARHLFGLSTECIVLNQKFEIFLNVLVDIPIGKLEPIVWSSGNESIEMSFEHNWYLNTWDHMKDELERECKWEREEPRIKAEACQNFKAGQNRRKKLEKDCAGAASQWGRVKPGEWVFVGFRMLLRSQLKSFTGSKNLVIYIRNKKYISKVREI